STRTSDPGMGQRDLAWQLGITSPQVGVTFSPNRLCTLETDAHEGRLGSRAMEGIRLTGTLTFWKALHPAWRPNPEWPEEVGFATWESTDVYVFIDPLVRDDLDAAAWQRFDDAVAQSDRPPAVLLTPPLHDRSAR